MKIYLLMALVGAIAALAHLSRRGAQPDQKSVGAPSGIPAHEAA
jgi:hypothetical protein